MREDAAHKLRIECSVDGRVSTPVGDVAVIRSLLASNAALAAVQSGYAVGSLNECALIRTFVSDVYLLAGPDERYVFKIYRPEWRDVPALLWEVDLLTHLSRRGAPVAPAIARRDGRAITAFAAPEGTRHGILFTCAAGEQPLPPFNADLYHRFGRAAALIHQRSEGFVSSYPRHPLDLSLLIDQPLQAIRPFLSHRPADWAYVVNLREKLRAGVLALADEGLDWGICHHDMTLDNVHVTPDGRVIFYDFDSGGPGWRSLEFQGIYDSALYNQNDHWAAFLHGYSEVRQLSRADLAAIPYFVLAYATWGTHMDIVRSRWHGMSSVNDEYFEQRIGPQGWWRRWESEHLLQSFSAL